jgi:predicted nucleic acid-binding protein
MSAYALDSNIVSYLLKRDAEVWKKYNQAVGAGATCIIPPIVYYEVRRGLLAIDATRQLQVFAKMCRELGVGRMTNAILDEAAQLYARNRKRGTVVDDSDLFIAAFCIVNDFILVTNNTKHFEGFAELEFTNWK